MGYVRTPKKEESSIQKDISDYLTSKGAEVYNPKTGSHSKKGTPDLLLCFQGLFIAIEVKQPGKKPSKLQQLRIKRDKKAGGIAFATDNLKEVKELINDISNVQRTNEPDGGSGL